MSPIFSSSQVLKIASALYFGLSRDLFSFQMSPQATYHCVASNTLPASYGLSEPVLKLVVFKCRRKNGVVLLMTHRH